MRHLESFHLEVYGCQMNVHDSEIMAGVLTEAGMHAATSPEEADVILVVSCAVREKAETRALGRAAQLCGLKDGGDLPLVGMCGCVAREHGERLFERLPALDLVVGPDSYRRLPDLLAGKAGRCSTAFRPESYDGVRPVRRDFPRSFVTVMRGCDNRCSYCIVPQVRGSERSRSVGAVMEEVATLAGEGYGEVTLLGQNVNSYRDGGVDFPGLLRMVAREVAPAWVRFVTSHPRDFGADLARAMGETPNVCPQLHLPVQSGSDSVLQAMGRGYTAGEYLEKVRMAREAVPGLVLSTDIIAGFPGESEEDFLLTVELLQRVGFDYAFLFRYSERRGTRAAAMEGALPVEERLARLARLQSLQRGMTIDRSKALLGREMEVLVTGPARLPGQQAARSPGNRMVVLEGTDYPPGRRVRVRIVGADGWTHFGRPANGP
jgi:tRNA-2-methylthio-N6-dimethylallyladenosine synthase